MSLPAGLAADERAPKAAAPGFRVSAGPLFDPASYARELEVYVAALLFLLRVPEPDAEAAALRAFHASFVAELPPPAPLAVSAEEAKHLFELSLHGIFKHLGSGAICCLLKTEPGVLSFGLPVSAAPPSAPAASPRRIPAESPPPRGRTLSPGPFRSSWDSVNFLPPEIVVAAEASTPGWLHRDARLGAAEDESWQGLFNVSPHAQDGPAGDACFVCIPGSQEDTWAEAELAAAAGEKKAAEARKKDWVRAADFGDVLLRGRGVERIAVCGGGGVGWDSRLLHSGSLFAAASRPHPRMVKYIYYFRADACPAAARKTHELMVKACSPETESEGGETEAAASGPLSRLPIAPTTPHRGNAKNSTGFLPTFRVTGAKRARVDKLNRLVAHPLVRPFFTLPHALARGLMLRYGEPPPPSGLAPPPSGLAPPPSKLAPPPSKLAPPSSKLAPPPSGLLALALAVMRRLRDGEGGEGAMTGPMLRAVDTLRGLHAAPEAKSRKRARVAACGSGSAAT